MRCEEDESLRAPWKKITKKIHLNYNATFTPSQFSYLAPKKLSIDLLSMDRCERVHEAPVIAGAVALPPKPETAA